MAEVQRFVQTNDAVQYDGTNSAEIIALLGRDPTVSEIDGVWTIDDGIRSPMTVHAGDWYFINGWFMSATNVSANYVPVPS
jgi:hypothetical protein